MSIDIKNIESLLAEKKYDEVRALINGVVKVDMTDKEKGEALVGMASMYLDISNAINIRYRDVLQQAVDGMMAIDRAESKSNDRARIVEVKSSLKA